MPKRTWDDVTQLIYDNIPRDLPLVPGVLLGAGSGPNRYACLVGPTSYDVLRVIPDPVVLPGCVVLQQMFKGGPWVVVTDNFWAPIPPGIDLGGIALVDGGAGPDGVFGTGDDEPGAGFDLYDEDGARLVER